MKVVHFSLNCLTVEKILKQGIAMILILNEIIRGWKRDLWLVLMLLGLSMAGIFCVGTACYLLTETERQTEAYREIYQDVQFYSIQDNLLTEAPIEVQKEENTPKFRKYLKLLSESQYFEYFMMYRQPVYIENYRGKFNNVENYEYKNDISDATQDIINGDGTVRTSTKVKAFWIGDSVIDYFGFRLSEGQPFGEEDFILKPDAPISVILGANYAEEYAVGDELFISFVFAERPAKVVGILEEGTNVYYRNSFRNLDTYVIMPIFINDSYEGEDIYDMNVNYFYSIRNSGTVATKLSIQDINEIIDIYVQEAGFEYHDADYVVQDAAKVQDATMEKSNFDQGIEAVFFLVSVIAVAAIVAACLFTGLCVANRTKKNQRYYAVLVLNGYGRGQICSMLLLDAAVIFLTAGLFSGALFAQIFGNSALSSVGVLRGLILGTAFFTAFPCAVTMFLFLKSDLIYYLKEEAGDAGGGQRDETL